MGDTRFKNLFRQTGFTVYSFLQKWMLVIESWFKKYIKKLYGNLGLEQVKIQRSHYSTLSLQLHPSNWKTTLGDAALF